MIKVVVIDTELERSNWLNRKLSLAGFLVVDSVIVPDLAVKSIAVHKPHIILIAPMSSKLEGAKLALSIMEEVPTPIILLYCKEAFDRDLDISWCGVVTTMAISTFSHAYADNGLIANIISNLQLMHIVPVVKRRSYNSKHNESSAKSSSTLAISHLEESTAPSNLVSKYSALKNLHYTINSTLQYSSSILPSKYSSPKIIGIASSTGGPKIVKVILNGLPQNYPIPIILVQHISTGFNKAFISMLATDSNLKVKEAVDREIPSPGTIYTAPAHYHLIVNNDKVFQLVPQNSLEGHCPSATAMFTSLAQTYASQAVGIILSGMGDDGADGLVFLKKAGGLTIAQEQASCLIDSMPTQAVSRGGIKLTLSPQDINNLLKKWTPF